MMPAVQCQWCCRSGVLRHSVCLCNWLTVPPPGQSWPVMLPHNWFLPALRAGGGCCLVVTCVSSPPSLRLNTFIVRLSTVQWKPYWGRPTDLSTRDHLKTSLTLSEKKSGPFLPSYPFLPYSYPSLSDQVRWGSERQLVKFLARSRNDLLYIFDSIIRMAFFSWKYLYISQKLLWLVSIL